MELALSGHGTGNQRSNTANTHLTVINNGSGFAAGIPRWQKQDDRRNRDLGCYPQHATVVNFHNAGSGSHRV